MNIKADIQKLISGEQWTIWLHQYKWMIALISFCAFIYIAAGYNTMRQEKHLSNLRREVRDAKFEYLTISATLIEKTRQSSVAAELAARNSRLQVNRKPAIAVD